ncbi:MAG: hypothetical protein QM811_01130 [Pirellulales bacterium]
MVMIENILVVRMSLSSSSAVRILAGLALSASVVWAQDPFAAGDPAVAPPAAKGGKKSAVPAGPPPSPAAAAILAGKPTTLEDLITSINTLDRLGEIELAKPLLGKLLAGNPDDAALAAAVTKFGSPIFFRMAKIEALQPQAAQFADRALAAAGKAARDPSRLKDQAAALAAATTENAQGPALAAPLTAGDVGAAAILAELRNDQLSSEGRSRLIGALREIGAGAVDPLLATLASDSVAQCAAAIELLPTLGGQAAAVGLFVPAFSGNDAEQKTAQAQLAATYGRVPGRPEAVAALKREANAWLSDDRRMPIDVAGKSVIWQWDDKAHRPAARSVDRREAQILRGLQWADDAVRLSPDDPVARSLWLTAHLRAAAWRDGFDAPQTSSPAEMKLVSAWGPGVVEEALAAAIKSGDQLTAAGAARLLAKTGTAASLKGPKPHPLVDAVRSNDPRVRFAALETLVGMNLKDNFLGAGYLNEAVAQIAGLRGQPAAVVGFRSAPVATQLAGFLVPSGIEGVPMTTGRGAVRAAQQSPDAEMILLSSWIDHEPLSLTIQELRRDVRTASLPIAILYEEGVEQAKLASLYDGQPNVSIFSRPYDDESVAFLVAQMRRKHDVSAVPAETRRKQGLFALTAMSRLLDLNPKLYDFRAQVPLLTLALDDAWRTEAAADVLARIGDHAAQTALVEFASRPEVPVGRRTAAVAALGEAVRRRGVQLTRPEIAAQYARYNGSATAPPETQKVLSAILDVLELPTKVDRAATTATN